MDAQARWAGAQAVSVRTQVSWWGGQRWDEFLAATCRRRYDRGSVFWV